MKQTKKATAGERIATSTRGVSCWVTLATRIDRSNTSTARKERERCVGILWRWHKSAQSAGTPLGQGVCEHLEAIIKEVGNPKQYP